MKVTYQWLKDFTEIKISPAALAEKLTMAGLEVVGYEQHGSDAMYEIEITSNRPDWLSVAGIAREAAAITSAKIKPSAFCAFKPAKKGKTPGVRIAIEDHKDCPLYTAAIIRGVKVGPSPSWLKERLERIGCRSINNVVDITNYCMYELGEPLHAFDLNKLGNAGIGVRRGCQGETLVTIDGQQRPLTREFLVITDGHKPVALAGVMGGKESEVDDSTTDVLLEAAIFNPMLIRKARQRFGLQTDSSYRFERGIPLETALHTARRAREMVVEVAGGRIETFSSSGNCTPFHREILLEVSAVSAFLGVKISEAQVKQTLIPLGFGVRSKKKGVFSVSVPYYRQDAKAAVDLVEDVARVYGFERIPSALAPIPARPQAYALKDFVVFTRNALTGLGVSEAVTLSLVPKSLLRDAGYPVESAVEIANPLSIEQEVMRPTLIPSLLVSVRTNFNRQEPHVQLFEIAHTFCSAGQQAPKEAVTLGVVLSGQRTFLLPQGQVKEQLGLLHMKGIIQAYLLRAGVAVVSFVEQGLGFDVLVAGKKAGTMGLVHKKNLDALDIKNKDVVFAEVDLEVVYAARNADKHYSRPPQFPGISRDISFYVRDEVMAGPVLGAIQGLALPLLESVEVTDSYKGKQVPQGSKGIVVSCQYRSSERTLTEQEVQPAHAAICQLLQTVFSATLR